MFTRLKREVEQCEDADQTNSTIHQRISIALTHIYAQRIDKQNNTWGYFAKMDRVELDEDWY
jgi:hypothetical protein